MFKVEPVSPSRVFSSKGNMVAKVPAGFWLVSVLVVLAHDVVTNAFVAGQAFAPVHFRFPFSSARSWDPNSSSYGRFVVAELQEPS